MVLLMSMIPQTITTVNGAPDLCSAMSQPLIVFTTSGYGACYYLFNLKSFIHIAEQHTKTP